MYTLIIGIIVITAAIQLFRSTYNIVLALIRLLQKSYNVMNNSSLISNLSIEVYTGWQIVFALITVLAAILSLLSISALFIAKKIDWNLRIILINLFSAELMSSIGYILTFMGYPLRRLFEVSDISQHQFSCSLSLAILVIGEATKVGSYTFYSIMVYVFMKKNISRLKVYIMVIPCLIIWLPSLALGSLFFLTRNFPMNAVLANKGLCTFDLSAQPYNRVIFAVFVLLLEGPVCGGVILTFFVLIACYMKKNVSNDNEIKVGIAKNLLFLGVGALLSIFTAVVIPVVVAVRMSADTSSFIVTHHILDIVGSLLNLYTPVVTIAFLKPIQEAVSQLIKKCLKLEQGETIELNTLN